MKNIDSINNGSFEIVTIGNSMYRRFAWSDWYVFCGTHYLPVVEYESLENTYKFYKAEQSLIAENE